MWRQLTTARRNSIFFPQTSLTSVSTTISVLVFIRRPRNDKKASIIQIAQINDKSQETHKWANMWFKIWPLCNWQICLFVAFLCFFFFRKRANYEYLCWLKRWPLCNWEVGSACSSPPPEVPVEIRRVGTFTSPFYSFKRIWNEKW